MQTNGKAHIEFKTETLIRTGSLKRNYDMFEATTNPAARTAMNSAHAARGQMMADFFAWLRGGA